METWRMPGAFPTEDEDESAPNDQNLAQPQPNTPRPTIIGCVSLTKDTDDTALVDIVVVHGLTGDAVQSWTWTSQPGTGGTDVCWPRDLLRKTIKAARAFTFGYDADVWQFLSVAPANDVYQHGKSLVTSLANLRDESNTDPERRMLFVAHSLGRLVVEELTLSSRGVLDLREQCRVISNISKATHGIVFLGTPHIGSEKAAWAAFAAKYVLLDYFKRCHKELLVTLTPDSKNLGRIEDHFLTAWRRRAASESGKFHLMNFHEELPSGRIGKIVEDHSAAIAGVPSQSIRGNHTTIAKFESLEDPGYKAVSGALARWYRDLAKDAAEREKSERAKRLLDRWNLGNATAATPNPNIMPTKSKSIPLEHEDDWKILVKGVLGDVSHVNQLDDHDLYPLGRAAILGIPGLVQHLLDLGADVHSKDNRGWTALELAARNGKAPVVRLLAKHGAKIDDRDNDGWSPMERAILMGEFACVKALVELGCNVNETDSQKISPLWLAARHGRAAIARFLIDNGADVAAVDDSGFTPFQIAIKYNEMEVVRVVKDALERIVTDAAGEEFQKTGKEVQLSVDAVLDDGDDVT